MQTTSDTSINQTTQQEIVSRLLQVISAELPITEVTHLLDAQVSAYMDDKKISSGRRPWQKWVLFLHRIAKSRGIENLRIVVDTMHSEGDKVDVRARWLGVVDGKEICSDIGSVIYQVQNGKIIAIWTHKANYVFIYGDKIKNPLFFFVLILRVMFFAPKEQLADESN